MDQQIRSTCQEALGEHARILTYEETEEVFQLFKEKFPMTKEGRIDCCQMKKCHFVSNTNGIASHLFTITQHNRELVYVLWNDMDLPAGELYLSDAIANFDNIEKLSFDTWVFSLEKHYIIESHHTYGITIGITSYHDSF